MDFTSSFVRYFKICSRFSFLKLSISREIRYSEIDSSLTPLQKELWQSSVYYDCEREKYNKQVSIRFRYPLSPANLLLGPHYLKDLLDQSSSICQFSRHDLVQNRFESLCRFHSRLKKAERRISGCSSRGRERS